VDVTLPIRPELLESQALFIQVRLQIFLSLANESVIPLSICPDPT